MSKKKFLVIIVIVVAAVLLSILFHTMLANHLPAITSLEAEPQIVLPSGSCQVVCIASDPDGDELSYNWSASGGEINGAGATVTWTAPDLEGYHEGLYNVAVMVTDGRGVEVTKHVIITVRANWPPTITSLVADADWTFPLGSTQVTCTASDPDDDELSYEWSTTGGDISGTGAVVNWTAPQEFGIYDITVVVTDVYGDGATRSVTPSMALGTPPIIEDLNVTADLYLRESLFGYDYDVFWPGKYYIECTVSDTDSEVSYKWSCDDGEISEISEDGSMITWAVPNKTSIDITVTVIVSDIAGNRMGKSIAFYVPSCPCGF
jgi:hypothetical protein